jgi:hypothetical protein
MEPAAFVGESDGAQDEEQCQGEQGFAFHKYNFIYLLTAFTVMMLHYFFIINSCILV